MSDWTSKDSDPLRDIQKVANEMLSNTGLIPLCIDVGDATYCATFNGISYKYTTKFEGDTWHAVNPPLTYRELEALYGSDNLKPHRPVTFVGGS